MVAWVGVLPEARGQGLASACTARATNEAFARGAELVLLQASAMGESVYRRLGYEELYNYRLLGAMPD
jgi:predicted GNAT family acetyltransferase